jgi:hypothetical protein
MKTRWLSVFTVVITLALLIGGPTLTGAQGPEPPGAKLQELSCAPAESTDVTAPPVPWKRAPNGRLFGTKDARPASSETGTMPLATGGPDDYGYRWDDSVTPSWIDATSGTDTGMSGDSYDQAAGPISLPFSFKYYENTYSSLYVAAAGYLAFSSSYYWDDQDYVPSPAMPNNIVAPYWTPIYLNYAGPSGRIYYKSGGSYPNRYFVVEWYDVKGGPSSDSIGGDDTYRFEVILHENGDIVFQYQAMTYGGSNYWCGTAGIEDSAGLDGLNYVSYCSEAASYKAVHFYRPSPSARMRIRPLYYGRFVRPGEAATFEVPIQNLGELGSDTYDLFTSSAWPTGLYAADGVTPLTDTDSDGTVDTGPVPQNGISTITVRVTAPRYAAVGDNDTAAITVRSSIDLSKSRMPTLQAAIPAFFAQVFRDSADGAMSLYLAQPGAQTVKKVTSDYYYGYYPAIAEMPHSFAYFWTRSRSLGGNIYVREIEYTLLDRNGNTARGVTRLTDLSGATVSSYDYDPAVAVAPDGRIGAIWYRYLYNSSSGYWNYNIYYAILDARGNVIVPPTNLTNNPLWGYG